MTKVNNRICQADNCDNNARQNKWGAWSKYCSVECGKITGDKKRKEAHANLDQQAILEKRKATNLSKFGADNVAKTDDARRKISKASRANARKTVEKTKQNNLAKYGVESTNSLDTVKERKRQAYIEKYGVDHPLKVAEIARSVSEKNTRNAETRLGKAKQTNLAKYGHENASSAEAVKQKRTAVMQDRYGVSNPSQVLEFHNKKLASGYNSKDYTMPSGKVVKVQGYEDKALDILLKVYSENDICVHDGVPTIKYYSTDGKECRYFPDIYIPSKNLIIEVKSEYTFSSQVKWHETNLLKEHASITAGYNFQFMIL